MPVVVPLLVMSALTVSLPVAAFTLVADVRTLENAKVLYESNIPGQWYIPAADVRDDLLTATLYHPAMLRYLDNADNAAGHLNENYAREIMELHTMGVGSGYTQSDVEALARILTLERAATELHEGVGLLRTRAVDAARTVVLEAAADQMHAVGEQCRG